MKEGFNNHELDSKKEYSPTPGIVDILKGEISEPLETTSQKKESEGQIVKVRIVKEGPGMIDLPNWRDNKEWSGMHNHPGLCAGYASYFAEELSRKGYNIDVQLVLDAMLVSHAGRRQWDEANWYPKIAPNSAEKKNKTNEQLGLELIKNKVKDGVYDLVAALGYKKEKCPVGPEVYDTLEYKIASYVDHTTDQEHKTLSKRMGNFAFRNFFDDKSKSDPGLEERISALIQEMIDEDVSLSEAERRFSNIGAKDNSARLPRKEFTQMILDDAKTERMLVKLEIDLGIGNNVIAIPLWVYQLRERYAMAAKEEIIKNKETILKDSESDKNKDNWWNKYVEDYLNKIKNERKNLY